MIYKTFKILHLRTSVKYNAELLIIEPAIFKQQPPDRFVDLERISECLGMPHRHVIRIQCKCAPNNFVKDGETQINALLAQSKILEFDILLADVVGEVALVLFESLKLFLLVKDVTSPS